jgi:hypothetical protein
MKEMVLIGYNHTGKSVLVPGEHAAIIIENFRRQGIENIEVFENRSDEYLSRLTDAQTVHQDFLSKTFEYNMDIERLSIETNKIFPPNYNIKKRKSKNRRSRFNHVKGKWQRFGRSNLKL